MQKRMVKAITMWLLLVTAGIGFGQQPGAKLWEYAAKGRVNSSPALGPDGTIYFGAGTNLVALNPNGSMRWELTALGQVYASPAIGHDGTVYIGAFDQNFYAITPVGTRKWTMATGGRIFSSAAIDMDGTIYFGSDDSYLYAVNPDGTQKWAFGTGGFVRSSPAIGADGTIYVGSWDNHLYALSPAGTQKWAFATGHYVYSSPAIAADGTIYTGSVDTKLYALNSDGSKKWAFTTASHVYASPALGPDGTIYFGSWDNRLHALSPAGTQKWVFATGNLVQSSPAVGADGTVYFGSDENKIYAVNPDGSKKWAFTTGSLIRSSPVLANDGTLYVGSEDFRLYAIKGTSGLALSPWPMFRGDPRHRAKVLLTITRQPQSQVVVMGNSASFDVAASGAGPLSFQWRLNGANLPGATEAIVTLTNLQSAHAGDYTVLVSNRVEAVLSAPATLKVIVPAVITLQPQSQTAIAGTNLALKVTATSLGPMTYQWFFNGTNLVGAIAPMLPLPDLQSANAGNYTVVVSNPAGAVTSAVANLVVVSPPEIIQQPTNQVGAVGNNVTFVVAANSLAPINYQWRFNGTNLPGANAATLTLKNIQPENAGSYTVTASNIAGMVTSAAANLAVAFPPLITTHPKSQTGIAGKSVTFNVTVLSAGPLTYQWLFNDADLVGATSSNLVLTNLHPNHAGEYSVAISNIAGSMTSSPAVLKVLVPPTVTVHPLSQTGAIGKTITFHVTADGTPPMSYAWQFKGANLPGATNDSLVLGPITLDHVGNYVVVISNTAGASVSRPASLTIPRRPGFWDRIKGWL